MLKELNSCIGKTFIGWKGGEFKMDKDTPVWISEKGECSNNSIASIVRMRKNLRFSIVHVEDDFIDEFLKVYELFETDDQTPVEIIDTLFIDGERQFRENYLRYRNDPDNKKKT